MSYKSKFIFPVSENPTREHFERLIQTLEIEFKSIEKDKSTGGGSTIISVPIGGSGGAVPSGRDALFVNQSVTAGIPTISFADLGTALYGAYGFVLKSGGDVGLAIPQIPPLSDSRTSNSCKVQVFDTGTLCLFIILP